MSKHVLLCLSVCALVIGAAIVATADVPPLINYQGVLLKANGQPLTNATRDVTFTIFDVSTIGIGTAIWGPQTHTVTTDNNGSFSVLLGSLDPILDAKFDEPDRWLAIQICDPPSIPCPGAEIDPRIRLTTVPYAFRTNTLEGAKGGRVYGRMAFLRARKSPQLPMGDTHICDTCMAIVFNLDSNVASISFYDSSGNTTVHIDADGSAFFAGPVQSGNNSLITDGPNDRIISTTGEINLGRDPGTGSFSDVKVGVGTQNPAFTLDVNGTAQMTGFKMPTGAISGNVLISDAAGVGTWLPAAGGADNDWTLGTPGNDVLFTIGAWGIARDGNTLFGTGDFTHVNLGVSSTTGASGQNYNYATVSGGQDNTASNTHATVGGGFQNTASGERATVSGGGGNSASAFHSAVGGGFLNGASGLSSTVAGGERSIASNIASTVGGGYDNTASGNRSTVSGGWDNTASGDLSSVGGGVSNTASGVSATVPGGNNNGASGDYSFAAGRLAKAIHSGSFVWADGTGAAFTSTAANEFLVRASGGVGFYGGNVGIGTQAIAYRFEVAGPVMMENSGVPVTAVDHAGIYAVGAGASTETWTIDAAGNTTQLSPHDPETGEWIFYSKNVKTGRVVRVDMERMVRKIEELTGESFMVETWEQ